MNEAADRARESMAFAEPSPNIGVRTQEPIIDQRFADSLKCP